MGPFPFAQAARIATGCAALLLAGVLAVPAASADTLREGFLSLPRESRSAVQSELARAELFLAPADGTWSSWTDRALRRGADRVAQVTGGEVHPDLYDPDGVTTYLSALESGMLSKLLAPASPEEPPDNGLFDFLNQY